MFNSITLIGYLGSEPELRQAGEDQVCGFSLATNAKRRGEDHTEWFDVSVWGRLGASMSQMLQKGSLVLVTGNLSTRQYQRRDGTTGVSLEVRADNIRLLNNGRPRDDRPAFGPSAREERRAHAPEQRSFGQRPAPPQFPAAPQDQRGDWVSPPQQQTMRFPDHPSVNAAREVFPDARPAPPGFHPQTGEQFASPFDSPATEGNPPPR